MLADDVKRQWLACFPGMHREWAETMLSTPGVAECLMVSTDAAGKLISSLLLRSHTMMMWGRQVPVSYLSMACTAPRYRGMGSMHHLLHQALEGAHSRGDMAVWLDPGADWLYDYYAHAGQWAPVVYTREDNYTSVHPFKAEGFHQIPLPDNETVYQAVNSYEHTLAANHSVMLHSPEDIALARARCRIYHGDMIAVAADGSDDIAALAVAEPDDFYKVVRVTAAMGSSEQAVSAVLEHVRRQFPDKRVTVITPAADNDTGGRRRSLTKAGAVRIVNVPGVLDLIARSAPKGWHKVIRVTDPVIADNSHTYVLRGGRGAVVDDSAVPSLLEGFDVDVSVLARMAYGSKPIASIIDFPAQRPVVRLMLER